MRRCDKWDQCGELLTRLRKGRVRWHLIGGDKEIDVGSLEGWMFPGETSKCKGAPIGMRWNCPRMAGRHCGRGSSGSNAGEPSVHVPPPEKKLGFLKRSWRRRRVLIRSGVIMISEDRLRALRAWILKGRVRARGGELRGALREQVRAFLGAGGGVGWGPPGRFLRLPSASPAPSAQCPGSASLHRQLHPEPQGGSSFLSQSAFPESSNFYFRFV